METILVEFNWYKSQTRSYKKVISFCLFFRKHDVPIDGDDNPFTSYGIHVATFYYDSKSADVVKETANELASSLRGIVGFLLVDV